MNHYKLLPQGAKRITKLYYEREKNAEVSKAIMEALIRKDNNEDYRSILLKYPFLDANNFDFNTKEYDKYKMAEYYYNQEINVNSKTPITLERLKERGFYLIHEGINVWHFGNQDSGFELQPKASIGDGKDAEWIFYVALASYYSAGGRTFKEMWATYFYMEELEQLIVALQLDQTKYINS